MTSTTSPLRRMMPCPAARPPLPNPPPPPPPRLKSRWAGLWPLSMAKAWLVPPPPGPRTKVHVSPAADDAAAGRPLAGLRLGVPEVEVGGRPLRAVDRDRELVELGVVLVAERPGLALDPDVADVPVVRAVLAVLAGGEHADDP